MAGDRKILYCVGTKAINIECYSTTSVPAEYSFITKRYDTTYNNYKQIDRANGSFKNKKYNLSKQDFIDSYVKSKRLQCFDQRLYAQRFAKSQLSNLSNNSLMLEQEFPVYIIEFNMEYAGLYCEEELNFTSDYIEHKTKALILPIEAIVNNPNVACLKSAEVSIKKIYFDTKDFDMMNKNDENACGCSIT